MTRRTKTEKRLVGAAWTGTFMAVLAIAVGTRGAAAQANKACELLTPSELETAIGANVTLATAGAGCTARTPTGMVLLTLRETKTGAEADAELASAVTRAKQRGIQMDVKKFGPVYCTTMSPMKDVKAPFLTSCSVVKGTRAAVIEVTARSQKDMVSVEKLHTLAEKMASRF
jgi:hypothetical protein